MFTESNHHIELREGRLDWTLRSTRSELNLLISVISQFIPMALELNKEKKRKKKKDRNEEVKFLQSRRWFKLNSAQSSIFSLKSTNSNVA